jgi:hypothetical protein
MTKIAVVASPSPSKIGGSVCVSSVPESGTWLLRDILEMAADLKAHEPQIGPGMPDYADEMLIEFPTGKFFSWHSTLTPKSVAHL